MLRFQKILIHMYCFFSLCINCVTYALEDSNQKGEAKKNYNPNLFKVSERETAIDIDTPWGVKTITTPYGFKEDFGSYRLEIPIKNWETLDQEKEALKNNNKEPGSEKILEIIKTDARSPSSLPPTVDPKSELNMLILEANHLFSKGYYYKASLVVDELTKKFPDYPRGWVMMGSILKVLHEDELSKEAYKKALALDPKNTSLQGLVQ